MQKKPTEDYQLGALSGAAGGSERSSKLRAAPLTAPGW